MSKDWLKEWVDRVGEDEARKILKQAGRRGTAVHDMAEKYVMGDPDYAKGAMPVNVVTFRGLKKLLDEHVTTVYGIELPLYSKALYAAGRTDMIALWDGVLSVCDYKTSRRIKGEDDILAYFIQLTAYAFMASMIYGITIKQIVIMMAVDNEEPRYFVKNVKDYLEVMVKMFTDHKKVWIET